MHALPSEIQRLAPFIAVGVLAVLGLLLVTRVTGGSGGGEDAAALTRKAFTDGPRTATFQLRIDAAFEGAGQPVGYSATMNGPAQEGGAGKTEKSDIALAEKAPGKDDVSIRLRSIGTKGYVQAQGRWYTVTPREFKRIFEDDEGETATDPGLDLQKWVQNPEVAGSTRVDGVEAWRVVGDVDVAAMMSDPGRFGADEGSSGDDLRPDPARAGSAELLIAKEDGFLRKVEVVAPVVSSRTDVRVTGQLKFDLAVRNVNEPVEVEAPRAALPAGRLSEVPRATFGSFAKTIRPPAKRVARRDGAGGSKRRSRQAYVNCVAQAPDAAALDKCQSLVP